MPALRVIIVGLRMGAVWARAAQRVKGIELVGLVDIDQSRCQEAAAETGLSAGQSFDTLAKAQTALHADIAVIATPNHLHLPHIQQAYEAGLHVICEKPLAESMSSALALRTLTQAYPQRKLMIGQNYRWVPAVEAMRQAVAGGLIGKVGYVNLEFQKSIIIDGWRRELPEVLLEDMSIHHFDLLRFILGAEPVDVFARTQRPSWSTSPGRPNANCLWRMSGDIEVNYCASWVAQGRQTPWHGAWRIAGDQGAIQWDGNPVEPTLYLTQWNARGERKSLALVEEPLPLIAMPYTNQEYGLAEMAAAIQGNRQPQTHLEDNLRSFAMSRAAVESARLNRVVTIDELLPE